MQILVYKGLIKGFEFVNPFYIKIFFRFDVKKGLSVLKKIRLLTKTSLRRHITLVNLFHLQFNTKSYLPSFYIISTREGLVPVDTLMLPKTGGELIYKIN
jgi:hypothetical protein